MKRILTLPVLFLLFILASCKKEDVKVDQATQPAMTNKTNALGDVPIYSYVSNMYTDHIYSTNNKPYLEDDPSYVQEGIAFYAYPTPSTETIPVYSYASNWWADHIYSRNNVPRLAGDGTYIQEGIAFYVTR